MFRIEKAMVCKSVSASGSCNYPDLVWRKVGLPAVPDRPMDWGSGKMKDVCARED
jgi:hypothetical protein